MRMLTEGEFQATFTMRMIRIPTTDPPPFDFWDYFEEIPPVDFRGFDCTGGHVDAVWQTSGGRYQHVLIRTHVRNAFMALVLIVPDKSVYGHRILDLKQATRLDPNEPSL